MHIIGLSTPFASVSLCINKSKRGLSVIGLALQRSRSQNFRSITSANHRFNMAPQTVAGESVTINDRQYRAVREGLAQILAPYRENNSSAADQKAARKAHNNDEGDQAVFYNPIQQYNRDLSVLAILTYGESAIVEKQVKYAKKDRGKKPKKKGKGNPGAEAVGAGNQSAKVEPSKKRKADELEDIDAARPGAVKKVMTPKEFHSGDHTEEILQVAAGDGVVIVTEQVDETKKTANVEDSATTATATTTEATSKPVPFTILDALSASGLRAIRYAKEIPFATNVVANDLSSEAVKSIELNIDHNELKGKVHSNVGDARAYMYSKIGNENTKAPPGYVHRFDVVDLDPYGTAAPFLDSAVQCLTDGGLLCVTCTDAGVFASNGYPEKAFSLYGGVTMKGAFSHEAGLRLILHAVATSAAKYGIAIEPLLSLSIDFYARLFIRVHRQQQQVKPLAGTTMIAYNCDGGCTAWETQLVSRNQEKKDKNGDTILKHSYAQGPTTSPLCDHCGTKMHVGGPMWAGPLHNPYFIQRILDKLPDIDKSTYHTTDRIRGMLTLALEEDLTLASSNNSSADETTSASASADPKVIPRLPPHIIDTAPFFFIPSYVAKILHAATPPEDPLRGAIRHLGYKVTRSHCKPGSFKTNAPWEVIWEVMREWVRQRSPVKPEKVVKGMPGWKIMQRMRGTETKTFMDVQESVKRALERGLDGREELKSLLESGLYRLEHPRVEDAEETTATNGEAKGSTATEVTDASKPAWNEPRDVSKLKIVFDAELGKEKPRGKLVRYQINPRANWGPMNRAG